MLIKINTLAVAHQQYHNNMMKGTASKKGRQACLAPAIFFIVNYMNYDLLKYSYLCDSQYALFQLMIMLNMI